MPVERCWILLGRRHGPFWYARRTRPTRGEPASVAFDGVWVLVREELHGDVVGFYHTHPAGPPEPSRRDIKTMRAWATAFGKPLLCVIEASGEIAAHRFDDDRSSGMKLTACQLLPRNIMLAFDANESAHDSPTAS